MKKVVCFVSFLIFSFLLGKGYSQGLDFGIKGGINFEKFSNVSIIDEEYKKGYHAGVFLDVDLNYLGVQAEALYNRLPIDKTHLDYISAPVLLELQAIRYLSLQVGPQFSFLANTDKKYKDAFKTSDVDLVFGLEVNLPVLVLYGRYVKGMTDVTKNGGRSDLFQIGVGLKFL